MNEYQDIKSTLIELMLDDMECTNPTLDRDVEREELNRVLITAIIRKIPQ